MKSFRWNVMSSLAIFLASTSTSWGQGPPPMGMTQCEMTGSIKTCTGEMLDVQLEMINELEGMIGDMQAMGVFSLIQERSGVAARGSDMQDDLADLFARIETLKSQHGRGMEATEASTDDEFDEALDLGDMEKGKKCKFSDKNFVDSFRDEEGNLDADLLASFDLKLTPELLMKNTSHFGNDKCDIFTAENLAGISVTVNERKENLCEKVCKEKMVGMQGQMGKSKERFVGNFADAIGAARGAMQNLSNQRARMSELGLVLAERRLSKADFQLSQGPVDPCAPGNPGPPDELITVRDLNTAIVVLDAIVIGGNILSEVLGAIQDVMKITGNQDIGGFNGESAAIVVNIAFHISKGIFGVVGGAKNILNDSKSIVVTNAKISSASKADKAKACTKIVRDDTVKLQDDLFAEFKCDGGSKAGDPCIKVDDCPGGGTCEGGAILELQKSAGDTKVALTALQTELALVKRLLEETRDLLLTPPGQRKGFNLRP